MDERDLQRRYERLTQVIEACGSLCIGYSGGVDSVFLAAVAVRVLGPARVLAVTGRSAAVPAVQRDVAVECARRFGIPHIEIETDELSNPNYTTNPSNRCYFCKTELWSALWPIARGRRLAVVADGSNADDLSDYRPGARAGVEQSVRSPLQEAGLTKADIRTLSHAMGLPTWDQPAAPCLSSRLPYGLAVTPERLRQVEDAEAMMRTLGFREFRVRHHGDCARIEVSVAEFEAATTRAAEIAPLLRSAGFARVLLDVQGYRRGALNETLPLVQLGGAA